MTDRRAFLQGAVLASAATGAAESAGVPLREKLFGCIAGCHIGSSMGAVVEGWPY